MDRPEICIILNPGSGKRDVGSTPESIQAAFLVPVAVKLIKDGSEIEPQTKAAVAEGFKTIVAAGGDGTICGVASALRGEDATMGILPLGTFNYFARSLGLPPDLEAAAQVVVDGKVAPLRIATVNGRVFLNNASLGAYPAILATREDIYKRWGRSQIAAYWAVIKTLLTPRAPMRLRITVPGKVREVRSPTVFVVNNAYQLKEMAVEGEDRIAAGELVVFVAPDTSRFEMIRLAITIAMGRGLPDKTFELLSGPYVLIESIGKPPRHRRFIARDGERERLNGPFHLRVVDGALRVLVPKTRGDSLR